MRRLGFTQVIANKVCSLSSNQHLKYVCIHNAWKNRCQKYILEWCCERDVYLGDDSERTYCPVCGKYQFVHEFDVCPWCGWEHDMVQEEDPDYNGGANKMSLNQAREAYRKGEKVL